tara:strand:+ start:18861 stop:19127 length:267 start_codon:yes stop_codon:yes gene_type:complete
MKQPNPALMLHLNIISALNYASELDTTSGLKKALRTLEAFAANSSNSFETSEQGSQYQERAMHNFNVIMESIDIDTLLCEIGDLTVEK